ncbi:hypothetical protein PVL29_022836 [Vitis rotundifolia]|uniref:Uncharacterized protein n=1 Tax=Vitis rotundifolia TaxID=103349 RepID=A0AA38YX09_VITRO|nr:hypothetical protein PVL29_022836 [Vitis rotundifolia]
MSAVALHLSFTLLHPHSTKPNYPIFRSRSPSTKISLGLVFSSHSSISRNEQGAFDPELRPVLELATDSELFELERILFGPSYFSPLLKSITRRADVDYAMIEEDLEEREDFISSLESRFLFLAADARSTLSEESEALPKSWENSKASTSHGNLELGLSQWKVQAVAALGAGARELRSIILKGGSMLTLGKIYQLLARRLSGKLFLEAANYQIKNEVIKKGFAGAASRYLGLRSTIALFGPVLWGTFLADVVIQMLGTDYARILRAIYAFAQIRITRTYRLPSDGDREFYC